MTTVAQMELIHEFLDGVDPAKQGSQEDAEQLVADFLKQTGADPFLECVLSSIPCVYRVQFRLGSKQAIGRIMVTEFFHVQPKEKIIHPIKEHNFSTMERCYKARVEAEALRAVTPLSSQQLSNETKRL